MARTSKISKKRSINLLESIGAPNDAWTSIYNWVTKIGRYLLVSVELIVLAVFFARFFLDRVNNDLTDSINVKVEILSNQNLREEEIKYRNLQMVLGDIDKLQRGQKINSSEVSSILSSVPDGLILDKYAYSDGRVSLNLIGTDFETIKNYEFSLRQNPEYVDVNVTVSKSGVSNSDIDVAITFKLANSIIDGAK